MLQSKYHAVNYINKINKSRVDNYDQICFKFQHLLYALYSEYRVELDKFVSYAGYQIAGEITMDTCTNFFIDYEFKNEKKKLEFQKFYSNALATALSLKKDTRLEKLPDTPAGVYLRRLSYAKDSRYRQAIAPALKAELLNLYYKDEETAEWYIAAIAGGQFTLSMKGLISFLEFAYK